GRAARSRAWPPPGADSRERPERPAAAVVARARRLRPGGPVERRFPPRPARAAQRRPGGLLPRLRDPAGPGAGAGARLRVRRPLLGLSPPSPWASHHGPLRAPLPRLPPEPRPGGQSRAGRAQQPPDEPGTPEGRRGAGVDGAVRADAVPG